MLDVVSWTTLISGYAQQGQPEKALKCFDDMLHQGYSPNVTIFICVLKTCGSIRASAKGEEIHEKIVRLGMLQKNVVLGTTLVDMYAKCGALAKAHQVLKELPMRNVVSWSALIAGYTQHGQGREALKCFDDMLCDGHSPDAVTFISVLKACGSIGAAAKGEEIHDKIVSLGMLEKEAVLGNALVDMYAKCGALAKAHRVLKELPMCNVVSWSALIGGYAQHGQGEEALKCFSDMLSDGHTPNAITFICVLKACGSIGAAAKGEEIHDKIVSLGMLEREVVLGNTLVDMYAKCGQLDKAYRVLKELPMCDVVSWNVLIAGYTQHGQGEEALKCFDGMLRDGYSPNAITFICALKACGSIRAVAKGEEIHGCIVSLGMLEKDVLVGTTLMDMYAKCGELDKAHQLLKELPLCDRVSWNALIVRYAEHRQGEAALKCFDEMLRDGHSPDAISFVCVLKACASIGAAAKGEEIHEKIVSLGMLEKDLVLGTALVDMYAKCGALAKAHGVLRELPMRNVVSWSALIAGYTQHGQGEEALKCFDDMLSDGHHPDVVTFLCVLKACGSIGSVAKGEEIHDKIVSLGMLEKCFVLGTALMDMYVKCGELAKAHLVLKELPMCDVASWDALIALYAQHGQEEEAIKCFDDMLRDGHSPNAITFICVLNACGNIGAAVKGEEIHDNAVSLGMLEKDHVGTTLVEMYAKCGELAKAQRVLKELPMRDVISWNALIVGYVQHGQGEKALKCFEDMLGDGHSPNIISFICVLKACGSIRAAAKGKEIHEKIISLGMLEKNVVLGTTLVDMYAKCGALSKAYKVLKSLPVCNVVSWSALITGYAEHRQGEEALKCFDDMLCDGHSPDAITFICVLKVCGSIGAVAKGDEIHDKIVSFGMLEKNVVLGNTLVNMYAKCGALTKACQVLKELPMRDVVSWNALITGYAQHGQGEEALKCFDDMLCDGHSPDAITFNCVLKACGSIRAAAMGEEIHDKIVSLGMLEKEIVLGNTLVDMYVKCGELDKGHQVLKELPVRDVVSWNALIAGYNQHGKGEEALKCFVDMLQDGHSPNAITFACVLKACGSIGAAAKGEEIHDKIVSLGMLEKDVVLGNTLVDMYAKCSHLPKAHRVLKELPMRDVVSWNALIAGYAQHGQGEESLKCLDDMICDGHSPDVITFVCVLKACGIIGAAAKGGEVHDKIVSLGMLKKDVVLGNALVDMYVKCGALAKAQQVLKELAIHDAVCWNALIAGYAQQGESVEAINCFERMQFCGVKPGLISMTIVFNACSHAGLLDHAETYFSGMNEKYGICPCLEHYGCMIDAFGRAGKFNKALSVIAGMPNDKSLSGWVALLGACRKWAEVKIGKLAFERALNLDKCKAAVYILMTDIYTAAGMQEEAHAVEVMRVVNKAWKRPGCWWTDAIGNVHSFIVKDMKHAQRGRYLWKVKRSCQ